MAAFDALGQGPERERLDRGPHGQLFVRIRGKLVSVAEDEPLLAAVQVFAACVGEGLGAAGPREERLVEVPAARAHVASDDVRVLRSEGDFDAPKPGHQEVTQHFVGLVQPPYVREARSRQEAVVTLVRCNLEVPCVAHEPVVVDDRQALRAPVGGVDLKPTLLQQGHLLGPR
jgi:hypothetical protein